MTDQQESFVTNLRLLMAELNWNQKRLSTATGIAPANISKILSGKTIPNLGTISKIAKAIGVEPSTLTSSPKEWEPRALHSFVERKVEALRPKIKKDAVLNGLFDAEKDARDLYFFGLLSGRVSQAFPAFAKYFLDPVDPHSGNITQLAEVVSELSPAAYALALVDRITKKGAEDILQALASMDDLAEVRAAINGVESLEKSPQQNEQEALRAENQKLKAENKKLREELVSLEAVVDTIPPETMLAFARYPPDRRALAWEVARDALEFDAREHSVEELVGLLLPALQKLADEHGLTVSNQFEKLISKPGKVGK